ncbi:MAG: ATP-binding protein, partial [Pseudomonadota bacterium]
QRLVQFMADNGSAFLERDNPDRAAENLGRISDMARRMGRIIRNLRAFARQESDTTATVDLVAAIQAAVDLSLPRCTRDRVALHWSPPPDPVPVLGGEVRLSQVLVNLINNAADAMAEQSDPRNITIALRDTPDSVVVEVADTGPGIDAPEKIFDPFYTTKAVGAAEGMGLGLSISYGIVQSFGGDIRGSNTSRGAEFTVALTPWTQEAAA